MDTDATFAACTLSSLRSRPNAVTVDSAMVNISRIGGPALAGVLITTVGYGWAALAAAAFGFLAPPVGPRSARFTDASGG